MIPTKEELVELIGMADILESKLKDIGLDYYASDAKYISSVLRRKIGEICGEEYFETLRNPNNGNK